MFSAEQTISADIFAIAASALALETFKSAFPNEFS
jgi:hypothetical protein